MTRRKLATMLTAMAVPAPALLRAARARAAVPIRATLYKDPQCTCCETYVHYLEQNGFQVEVKPINDLAKISHKAGVPEPLKGCHTMFIEEYVIDGHVPVETIRKLLAANPAIAGISLPGMPAGSPGMFGEKAGPLIVYGVNGDRTPPRIFDVD